MLVASAEVSRIWYIKMTNDTSSINSYNVILRLYIKQYIEV